MLNKFRNSLRALLVVIPAVFIFATVITNCAGSGDDCDGEVNVATADECTTYANENDCDDSSFENGVCTVSGCDNCEIIVDDGDPVIDVDDSGF